jgi:adenylate cyclase
LGAQIAEGLSWLWHHGLLRVLALTIGVMNVTFGAVFAHAVGTNPDCLVILRLVESQEGPRWEFAAAHLTTAGLTLTYRDQEVWSDVPQRQNLQSDVRFAQLVGEVVSSADRMNRMEGQLSVLRQFLSPPILSALEETGFEGELNTDLLTPKVCDVTVLFCDLRGFSHRAEEAADDLPGLLSRVNAALEVMSTVILYHGGVTGDFLGDAVLGFWGWPFGSDEAPLKACRAALSIRKAFAEVQQIEDHPLSDFRMGIGIAHGRAVAGKIGTSGRMSVTVFGPVVNLASRLEGMTKRLQVPILLDEATAALAREGLANDEGRVRQLATVLPYGMETPLTVSELVPPVGPLSPLTDRHLEIYEQGVEHFRAGRWKDAYDAFHQMPSSDQAQDFLLALIAQHGRSAPGNWRGVIELAGK